MPDRNQFVGREAIFEQLGIDTRKLGYVGLEFRTIDVKGILADGYATGRSFIDRDYVYAPEGAREWWVKGPVGNHPHVTAKYGLLTPAYEMREIVDELIGDPTGIIVTIQGVTNFGSHNPDLPYACIVAELGDEMLELNAALSVLPHIDSFATYRPHITLAYVREDMAADAMAELDFSLSRTRLAVVGVDYGKEFD
jgi:hypothetical protein